MSTWWDHDKSNKAKGITCKYCVTHPELIQTGLSEPKSLKCPICKAKFDNNGNIFDKQSYDSKVRYELEESMDDIWESIWGKEP